MSIIRKLILVICICLIFFSGFNILKPLIMYKTAENYYNEIASTKSQGDGEMTKKEKTMENQVGWIKIPGTKIDYPLMQGKDNEYYLTHLPNGKESGCGSIYADANCKKPFEDFLTVIYGHRMKDGSMFHGLADYESKDFFDEHNKVEFEVKGKKISGKVFAYGRVSGDSLLYSLYEDDLDYYKELIREECEIYEDIKEGKVVLLSTCTAELDSDRVVVFVNCPEK